jgi:excisionase family DNA binding protein
MWTGGQVSNIKPFRSSVQPLSTRFISLYGCYDDLYLSFKDYLKGKRILIEEYIDSIDKGVSNQMLYVVQPVQEITIKEAAERLGVSIKTIRRYVNDGKLHSTLRKGEKGITRHYLNAEEVDSLLDNVQENVQHEYVQADTEVVQEVSVQPVHTERQKAVFVAMATVNSIIDKRLEESKKEMFSLLEEYIGTVIELRSKIEALEKQKPWYARLMFWK